MDARTIAQYAGLVLPGDREKIKIATAIALAESGGDPNARNSNSNNTVDIGLWQINSVHRSSHPEWTEAYLKDPMNNARAMGEISGGGSNWCPWYVYETSCSPRHNGNYRNFLNQAETASESTGKAGPFGDLSPGDIISDTADLLNPVDAFKVLIQPLQNILSLATNAGDWLRDSNNWLRIIQVGGGIVLAITAVNTVVKPVIEKPVRQAIRAVK